MLQLHPELNLLDARRVCPRLQLSERLAPVRALCVLSPVQEPRRLPTADARGGPARSLPHGGARPARELLVLPGAITGAQNQGLGAQREMRRRGNTLHRGGRTAKRTAGRTSGGNISGGVLATAAVPSACPPPETMSLRGRGADRTTASEEDGWGWQQVMRQ